MMKMMILAGRKPGMTVEEFRNYVTKVHGPLVRSVPEVARRILHYHYNFPVSGATDVAFGHPLADTLDIVTQGWFESYEKQLETVREPKYVTIVHPDEGRFANEAAAVMHFTAEAAVVPGAISELKVFYFRRRRSGMSREDFQEQWRDSFAPALIGVPRFADAVASYVQNHVLPESDHPDGTDLKYFDVIDELRLHSAESLIALKQDDVALERIRRLEADLSDPTRTRALVTQTFKMIP
jgi:EthD domain